jgi:hypothetical protein
MWYLDDEVLVAVGAALEEALLLDTGHETETSSRIGNILFAGARGNR